MKLALTFLLILMILPLMTGVKKSGDRERRSVKSMRDVFRDHRQFECVEGGENCRADSNCCSRVCCQLSTGKRCAFKQTVGCDDIHLN
nr:conotoxin precursor I1 [Conus ebraeus]DAZ85829.1 TPA_inf: conotoxin precursor I1 [Conus ebraeus]